MRGLTGRSDPQADAQAELRRTLQRRRDRFDALQKAIADPERAGFVVVFTAETLPVAETLEVVDSLRAMHVEVTALIANRRSPADAGELLRIRRRGEDVHLARVRDRVPSVALLEVPLVAGELTGADSLARIADLLEAAG